MTNSVRVVVEYTPALYALLGLSDPPCPALITHSERTFYLAKSTPRWVLYKPSIQVGEIGFDPQQR